MASTLNVTLQKLDSRSKYILCRPNGGFADILNQMEKCWRYASENNRILVVDTTRSGMHDNFSNYFVAKTNENVHLKLSSGLLKLFNQFDVFPEELAHRVDNYHIKWMPEIKNFADAKTSVQVAVDFSREYDEFCLIHHQTGPGRLSLDCLERLKLKPDLAAQIAQTIKTLGPDYFAVHIRNTDYKTEYKVFFETIKNEVKGRRLLVCSDDVNCIDFARSYFDQTEILTVTNTPNLGGRPLHSHGVYPGLNAFEINRSMLVDLLALSLSKKLFFAKLTVGHTSGFSELAARLKDRKDVIQSLFGESIVDRFPYLNIQMGHRRYRPQGIPPVSHSKINKELIRGCVAKDDPIILEIGCNDGNHTLWFLDMFKNPRVYCFEPDPRAIERFKTKVGQRSNVTLAEIAISDHNGEVIFHQSDGQGSEEWAEARPQGWDLSGSIRKPKEHLAKHPWITFDKKITVTTSTLDAWCDKHGLETIDFIWMDVQGAEINVFRGGQNTLIKTRFVYTEYSDLELYEGQLNSGELIKYLGDLHFEVLIQYPEDILFGNRRIPRVPDKFHEGPS